MPLPEEITLIAVGFIASNSGIGLDRRLDAGVEATKSGKGVGTGAFVVGALFIVLGT